MLLVRRTDAGRVVNWPEVGRELGRDGGVVPKVALGDCEYGLSVDRRSISAGAFDARLGSAIGSGAIVCD